MTGRLSGSCHWNKVTDVVLIHDRNQVKHGLVVFWQNKQADEQHVRKLKLTAGITRSTIIEKLRLKHCVSFLLSILYTALIVTVENKQRGKKKRKKASYFLPLYS